jgi:aminoglycoside 6'-N-acetyltransferase I
MSLFEPYEPRTYAGRPADTPRDLIIRPAVLSDVLQIARLMVEREGGEADLFAQKLMREFERADLGAKRVLFVAAAQGAVVGFARLAFCVPGDSAPPNNVPEGWYLGGVVVAKSHRRRGIGRELTKRRLDWLADQRATTAWYVVNAENLASIALHEHFGFNEVTRDFVQPGVSFSGNGIGILFRHNF